MYDDQLVPQADLQFFISIFLDESSAIIKYIFRFGYHLGSMTSLKKPLSKIVRI